MPTLDDLDAAMLRPARSAPAISRLGGGTVLLAGTDQPWRVVGRSAAVYQLRQPGGRTLALRCPLADPEALDPGLAERYRALAVAPALAPLRAAGGPLVDRIAVFPQGLALPAHDFRSTSHPVIAMDWVPGPTLLAAADRAARAGDGSTLEALAESWAAAIAALAGAGFSHGDLAADNALVPPGEGVVLVDYDQSAWSGSPDPPPSGEFGPPVPGPGYAHPSPETPAGGKRDHFPALVVYASLRLLARWPELRQEHGDPAGRGGGVLLFAAGDLADPHGSPLFARLDELDDPIGRELTAVVREACRERPGATPPLAEIVSRLRRVERGGRPAAPPPAAAWPTDWSAWPERPSGAPPSHERRPPRPAPRPDAPRLPRPALDPPPWPDPRLGAPPPPALDRPARQRLLTRLNSLLLAGDDGAAWRLWTESGLDRDPEAVRDLGPKLANVGRRLLAGARAPAEADDPTAGHRPWHGAVPGRGGPAAEPPTVEAARRRALVERLADALDREDERAVLRVWPELRGDPIASHLAIRAEAVLAAAAGAAVAAAIADGDDEDVVASVAEAEEHGVAVGAEARRAARAAAERTATRQALREAAAADDRPALAALALSGRLGEIGRLEPGERRAALRALAWPHLERALAADDDAAILAAADDDLFAEGHALTPQQRARIDLARTRTAWLHETRAALRRRDPAALRAALVKPPPGAEARLSRVERGRIARLTARQEAADELARALRDGPDSAILAALSRVEAAGAPLPEALDWAAVRGVVDRVSLAESIRAAAAADPPDYARLARLLPAARAAMVEGGAGLGPDLDFARLETDVLRAAHLARLREALATDDDAEIAAAAHPDPYDAFARLPVAQRERVERAFGFRPGR